MQRKLESCVGRDGLGHGKAGARSQWPAALWPLRLSPDGRFPSIPWKRVGKHPFRGRGRWGGRRGVKPQAGPPPGQRPGQQCRCPAASDAHSAATLAADCDQEIRPGADTYFGCRSWSGQGPAFLTSSQACRAAGRRERTHGFGTLPPCRSQIPVPGGVYGKALVAWHFLHRPCSPHDASVEAGPRRGGAWLPKDERRGGVLRCRHRLGF